MGVVRNKIAKCAYICLNKIANTVKKILLLPLLMILLTWNIAAQVLQPVHWDVDSKSLDNGEFILTFSTKIDKGFYLYSQNVPPDGPLPTVFEFSKAKDITLMGPIKESSNHTKQGFDKVFEMEVKKFAEEATFEARIKLNKPEVSFTIPVEYMSCNDEKCVKLDEEFQFKLKYETKRISPAPKPEQSGGIISPPNKPFGTTTQTVVSPAGTSTSTTTVSKIPTSASNVTVTDAKGKTASATTSAASAQTTTATDAPLGSSTAQGIIAPPTWQYTAEDLGNNEYLIKYTAILQPGFNIYSSKLPSGGPIPTSITFANTNAIASQGDGLEEISNYKKEGFDPTFKMQVVKYTDTVTFQQRIKLAQPLEQLNGSINYMVCDDKQCVPQDEQFSIPLKQTALEPATAAPVQTTGGAEGSDLCGWAIFFFGFSAGLLALFTPCVFPMIPLTVSMFTKRTKDRRKGIRDALIYAISIVVIYVGLGLLVTALFGPAILSELSTNPWMNIGFFVLFVVFAFSFFGFYDINLPSWITNKADEAVDNSSGLTSIFFMAFTLALTSFSCTGPLIGSLLVQAAQGGLWCPAIGMTGFAMALALPFGLFAMFPQWLASLPKSGGWLNSVKVVLGFVEIIFALKFLSNADLVKQWGLLKREPFLIMWILLMITTGIYLLGLIKFPHDSPIKKISWQRLGFAGLFFVTAAFLIPGIFCKPLPIDLLAGFPPPITYSYGCGNEAGMADNNGVKHKNHCPHGLNCFHDYETGMAEARKQNKPVFIDFTGWACVNCRKMEENVWDKPGVIEKLRNDYVLISLYVDEKVELPENEKTEYVDYRGRKKRFETVGDKWAHLQTTCYNVNAQPYYVLLDKDENILVNPPKGYTPDIPTFGDYLQKGVDNYKNGTPEGKPNCDKAALGAK